MIKIKRFFLLFLFALILAPIFTIHAETYVNAGPIYTDTIWDKTGSPYIVDGSIMIPEGIQLTVSDGVEIYGGSDSDYSEIFVNKGSIVLNGKRDSPIYIHNMNDIFVTNGHVQINNTNIRTVSGITFNNSRVEIATSSISDSFGGITSKNSYVHISDSKITDNSRGLMIESNLGPFLMLNDEEEEAGYIGGIGNAFDNDGNIGVIINNSIITNNAKYAISNMSTSTVEAKNNWWGNTNGPQDSGINKVSSLVDYEPWLISEPEYKVEVPQTKCCSSILFLPGLEGSYLYKDESLSLGLGNITNTLWPPNRNDDIRKLFMNSNGSSTDTSIYSDKPIGSVFGLYSIYGKFMGFLDGLVSGGTIGEWKPFAYDWRKPINEVVSGQQTRPPNDGVITTESLIKSVEDLAVRSKTGKVTLIAHSNGGLVAKYLVKTLAYIGKENIIDNVISVAVPFLGTPQAIAGILHGDNQSLGYGILLKQSIARELGINMPSAYSLLPTAEYFSQILGPTIAFASSTVVNVNNGNYPVNIDSISDQNSFIIDSENARDNPKLSNTKLPIKGNELLLTAGNLLHSILDPYPWPITISRWAIAGWNLDTTKTVSYFSKLKCGLFALSPCKEITDYKNIDTKMGDGTLVMESAKYDNQNVVFADLETISEKEDTTIKHANILESSSTEDTIKKIITGGNVLPNKDICTDISTNPGLSCDQPKNLDESGVTTLVVSTHSPVDLHIYDKNGNHTGLINAPKEVEDDILTFFETKIPGSKFEIYDQDENDSDTYISLPDNGSEYSIVVNGNAMGTFTLEINRELGNTVLDHIEYSNLPVLPLTIASTSIKVIPKEILPTSSIASSSKPLEIDLDGNGSPEMSIKASKTSNNQVIKPAEYLDNLKKVVATLIKNDKDSKKIIKRIDQLKKIVEKGKFSQIHDYSSKIEKKLNHKKLKNLSEVEKREILDLIDLFIAQYE